MFVLSFFSLVSQKISIIFAARWPSFEYILTCQAFWLEDVMTQWCNPLTLKPEQSGFDTR